MRTFHFIKLDKIPLGYAFETKKNINEIHKLPYPPYPEGNSSYYCISKEILNFLQVSFFLTL